MNHVGFYCRSSHETGLIDVISMAQREDTQITVFTTPDVYTVVADGITDEGIRWELKQADSIETYLQNVSSICSDYIDFLFMFPIYRNLRSYTDFTPECKILLYLFNINTWTRSLWPPSYCIFDYIDLIWRKQILSNIDSVAVEYEPIRRNLQRKLTDSELNVYTLSPIIYRQSQSYPEDDDHLTISIPGKVSTNRRNYRTVLNAVESLSTTTQERFTLRLLGAPYGEDAQNVLEMAAELRDVGWRIDTYQERLPLEQFRRQLQTSDYILAPLAETVGDKLTVERYGLTKGTGSIRDALQYAKPLMVPDWFEIPSHLVDSTTTYDSTADLADTFQRLTVEKDQVTTHKSHAEQAARKYTLSNQRDTFRQILECVC